MGNVLIISETQTYIVSNVKLQLEKLGLEVYTSEFKVQEIYDNLNDPEAIIINVEEDYIKNLQEYLYIEDRSAEVNAPIFLIGETNDMDELEKNFRNDCISKKFSRPIDVKQVANDISNYIVGNGKSVKRKILVVDDSGAVLRNVKDWLEDQYTVVLANSGTTAIKALSLNKPDLILLDYEMPIVDGSQVLQMIRQESDFSDIPVIFLTSKDDRATVMKVMSLKPQGYLLKTLAPKDIVASINDFFEKKRFQDM